MCEVLVLFRRLSELSCPPGYRLTRADATGQRCQPCAAGTRISYGMSPARGRVDLRTAAKRRKRSSDESCTSLSFGFGVFHCALSSCPGFACPTASEVLPCSKGFYCPPGTPHPASYPCPKGTYGERPGLTSAESCIVCPVGFFCDTPGDDPVPCRKGFYCASQGLTRKDMTPCPAGTYGSK